MIDNSIIVDKISLSKLIYLKEFMYINILIIFFNA